MLVWSFGCKPPDSRRQTSPNMSAGVNPASTNAEVPPSWDKTRVPPPWVMSPPTSVPSADHSTAENPCMTPDPGFGTYGQWDSSITEGQMLCPTSPAGSTDGSIRVMFHFHGHEAIRKEWVQVTEDVVLVAVDQGNNSTAYTEEFANPSRFAALLQSTERGLQARLGRPAPLAKFGLSAWSAGYAAVREILNSEYRSRVDAVILLDGLHASTLETAAGRSELAPFVEFAQRAARDETLMFVSHSSIIPPNYTSTTQATSYLIWSLQGSPTETTDSDGLPIGLELYRRFDQEGFHALGLLGATKADHCAQVALYRYALRSYLLPRWGLGSK